MAKPTDGDSGIQRLLESLASPQSAQAWDEFLESFAPIIYQVVKLAENEPDHISDCFLFICERLSEHKFRRLKRFDPEGPAQFSTWLWVVVRNLCRDWRRREFGRQRVFRSINRLSGTEQAVYHRIYEQGLSNEAAFNHLRMEDAGLTRAQFDAGLEHIHQALTPRQLWLLSSRKHETESLERDSEARPGDAKSHIPDPAPDPEAALALKERFSALENALRQLSKPERLVITLRYEKGLTLQEIADLLNLKDAWTADRRIKEVLGTIRKHFESPSDVPAKTGDVSV